MRFKSKIFKKKWSKAKRQKAIIGAVVILLIVLSIWLPLRPISPGQSADESATKQSVAKTPNIGKIEDCSGQKFDCYHDYLVLRVKTAGPAEAMADMRSVYDTDGYVKNQCHQLSHVVGREALNKYDGLKQTFSHGDSFCWSGYYHGAVEAAMKDMSSEEIRGQANELCSGFSDAKKYSFDHYNCVHGMGHGLMAVEELDLFKSLDDCDLLLDEWERSSCYGGAYMENIMIESRGDGKSKYLKPDQPMYPCTEVGTKHKEQCYLMQTSYALQQNQYDFGSVFAQCRNLVDVDFIPTCYQSLGRDASGSVNSDLVMTKANCDQASDRDGLVNCMLGAVRDIISYNHSDVQANQFCQMFESDVASRCRQEMTTYYSTFR